MENCQNLLIGYNKIPTWIRLLEFNLLYFAGNICRSPIAEAVFKRLLAQEGKTDEVNHNMSHVTRNLSSMFPTRSDTNQAVQPLKMVKELKFGI